MTLVLKVTPMPDKRAQDYAETSPGRWQSDILVVASHIDHAKRATVVLRRNRRRALRDVLNLMMRASPARNVGSSPA